MVISQLELYPSREFDGPEATSHESDVMPSGILVFPVCPTLPLSLRKLTKLPGNQLSSDTIHPRPPAKKFAHLLSGVNFEIPSLLALAFTM